MHLDVPLVRPAEIYWRFRHDQGNAGIWCRPVNIQHQIHYLWAKVQVHAGGERSPSRTMNT